MLSSDCVVMHSIKLLLLSLVVPKAVRLLSELADRLSKFVECNDQHMRIY
jgi:hypothetical protein